MKATHNMCTPILNVTEYMYEQGHKHGQKHKIFSIKYFSIISAKYQQTVSNGTNSRRKTKKWKQNQFPHSPWVVCHRSAILRYRFFQLEPGWMGVGSGCGLRLNVHNTSSSYPNTLYLPCDHICQGSRRQLLYALMCAAQQGAQTSQVAPQLLVGNSFSNTVRHMSWKFHSRAACGQTSKEKIGTYTHPKPLLVTQPSDHPTGILCTHVKCMRARRIYVYIHTQIIDMNTHTASIRHAAASAPVNWSMSSSTAKSERRDHGPHAPVPLTSLGQSLSPRACMNHIN